MEPTSSGAPSGCQCRDYGWGRIRDQGFAFGIIGAEERPHGEGATPLLSVMEQDPRPTSQIRVDHRSQPYGLWWVMVVRVKLLPTAMMPPLRRPPDEDPAKPRHPSAPNSARKTALSVLESGCPLARTFRSIGAQPWSPPQLGRCGGTSRTRRWKGPEANPASA